MSTKEKGKKKNLPLMSFQNLDDQNVKYKFP